jgi:hypothetical protein
MDTTAVLMVFQVILLLGCGGGYWWTRRSLLGTRRSQTPGDSIQKSYSLSH